MRAGTGDYTVVIRFVTYADAQQNDPQAIERQAQFRWVSE